MAGTGANPTLDPLINTLEEAQVKLVGKIALVTGAGQGMGRAIARRFAEEGATVVALDLNLDNALATLDGIGEPSGAMALNVADSKAVAETFASIVQRFGRIDILVNNAGIGSVDSFADISDETWARVTGVNLDGAFYCAREAVRAMQKAAAPGVIVNVASTAAVSGDGPAHYVASKAALIGLTRSMAKELAPQGIRVNRWSPARPIRR